MRNTDHWKPTRVVRDAGTGVFSTNRKDIFGGSLYIADRQHAHYIPMLLEHIGGEVLDIGCGPVPYYEVYRDKSTGITCVDWAASAHGTQFVDHFVDLNEPGPLPFADGTFDSVVASDMIQHLKRPHALLAELARVLKPGGKIFLSAPFIYWMSEYPHEYYHLSEFALRDLTAASGMEVVQLTSYGGNVDVLMDSLNKLMPHGLSNRLFLMLSRLLDWTGWPRRNRERTKDRYAMGYCMVVRKPG